MTLFEFQRPLDARFAGSRIQIRRQECSEFDATSSLASSSEANARIKNEVVGFKIKGMSPNTASERKASDQHFRTDHLIAGIGERTVRGGLVMMSAHGLKFTLSIVATAIMARLLEPQDYGLIGMVGVALNFVSLFKDMGLNFATIQRAEINFQQISTLFWINVSMSLLITMLTVAIAPIIAWFYGEPRLTMIAVVLAAGFIFGGLAVQHEALLRRQMRFFALSTIALASMIAGYAVGITLALSGFHYWALVYSQLALLAANMLGVLLVCRWRPGRPRLDLGMRSMLSFGAISPAIH